MSAFSFVSKFWNTSIWYWILFRKWIMLIFFFDEKSDSRWSTKDTCMKSLLRLLRWLCGHGTLSDLRRDVRKMRELEQFRTYDSHHAPELRRDKWKRQCTQEELWWRRDPFWRVQRKVGEVWETHKKMQVVTESLLRRDYIYFWHSYRVVVAKWCARVFRVKKGS